MSSQSYANPQTPYWAPHSLVDEVSQLEISVAYSSLSAPTTNTIALWADQGTGVYPLTTTRGATDASTVAIIPNSGDISGVESILFADQAPATPGLHTEGGILYFGATDLEAIVPGTVVGPALATDTAFVRFDGITGELVQDSTFRWDNVNTVTLPGTGLRINGGGQSLLKYDNSFSAMGVGAGQSLTSGVSNNNTCLGNYCGQSVLAGTGNTLVGYSCANPMTTGAFNTALGVSACNNGSYNLCLGWHAGHVLDTTGTGNTLLGYAAGYGITTGTKNIVIQNNQALTGTLTTGTNNIIIGDTFPGNTSNEVHLGTVTQTKLYSLPMGQDSVTSIDTHNIGMDVGTGQVGKYEIPMGEVGFENLAVPYSRTFALINTFYPIQAVTTLITNLKFISPNPGEIQYTGNFPCHAHVAISLSASPGANNDAVTFGLFLDGVMISNTQYKQKFGTVTDSQVFSMHKVVHLSAGNVLSLHVENNSSTFAFLVSNFNLCAVMCC